MKKKLLSAILSTAMVASVLAGCGAKEAAAPVAEAPAATEAAEAEEVEEVEEEATEETNPTMQNVDPDRKKGKTGGSTESSSKLDEDGYLKFSLPWNFTISYGITMKENTNAKINTKRMRYPYKLTHTLNFSGNVQIAEGWRINFSSGYDFNFHKLSMTTASLSRDLHCFSMSGSVVLSPCCSSP